MERKEKGKREARKRGGGKKGGWEENKMELEKGAHESEIEMVIEKS